MNSAKLFYYHQVPNFGDVLNLNILNSVFNIDVIPANSKKCDLLAIGSLLEQFLWGNKPNLKFFKQKYLNHKMFIWGSGFISEQNTLVKRPDELHEVFYRKMEFSAVRGEYTKKRIEDILGKKLDGLALGDPGLLASKLIKEPRKSKKYKLGMIPHYVDKNNDIFQKINTNIANSVIIDVQADPIDVINQISECEVVISTAMHGLIVADSLGVPNQWCVCSDKLTGGSYKFYDYYSVFDMKNVIPIDLNSTDLTEDIITSIFDNYSVCQNKVANIQDKLIEAFPIRNFGFK